MLSSNLVIQKLRLSSRLAFIAKDAYQICSPVPSGGDLTNQEWPAMALKEQEIVTRKTLLE